MTPDKILTIYLLFFVVEFIFENWLTFLNIRNVNLNKNNVPEFFKEYITKEKYVKSTEYTLERSKFSVIQGFVSSTFLLIFIISGLFGYIDLLIQGLGLTKYLQSIIYIISLLNFIFKLISIPFSLYSQFVIEEKYGFNKMTKSLWIIDFIKGLVLSLVLSSILLLVLFWFMDKAGTFWWIYGFLFVTIFQIIMMIIYPILIAPIFNKFSPMEDGQLKDKLENLAKKLNFFTKGIFVMDGSKRSKHSNAYFTGFGKLKRIVLFDTLIDHLNEDELVGVLAHEIGHEKKHHVLKRVVVTLVISFIGFYIINFFLNYLPLFEAFGFSKLSYHGILVILSFCSGPFTFFLTPLFTSWSRKHDDRRGS